MSGRSPFDLEKKNKCRGEKNHPRRKAGKRRKAIPEGTSKREASTQKSATLTAELLGEKKRRAFRKCCAVNALATRRTILRRHEGNKGNF